MKLGYILLIVFVSGLVYSPSIVHIPLTDHLNKIAEANKSKSDFSKHSKIMDSFTQPYRNIPMKTKKQISASIGRYSVKYDVEPELLFSLMFVESSFNTKAISSADCVGLMQINYDVWKEELKLNKYKMYEVDYNIKNGCIILSRYKKKYDNNMLHVLNAYNGNSISVDSKYYKNVMRHYNKLVGDKC